MTTANDENGQADVEAFAARLNTVLLPAIGETVEAGIVVGNPSRKVYKLFKETANTGPSPGRFSMLVLTGGRVVMQSVKLSLRGEYESKRTLWHAPRGSVTIDCTVMRDVGGTDSRGDSFVDYAIRVRADDGTDLVAQMLASAGTGEELVRAMVEATGGEFDAETAMQPPGKVGTWWRAFTGFRRPGD